MSTNGFLRQVFLAFPASHHELSKTIQKAAIAAEAWGARKTRYLAWPELPILGQAISDKVRDEISRSDALVADITFSNPNVAYEIGYAVGLGKPIIPVINNSIAQPPEGFIREGVFDTIGYEKYDNSEQLEAILKKIPEVRLLDLYRRSINTSQPLYALDSRVKSDYRNAIFSAIKDARIFFRSFDPVETSRFSLIKVIGEIAASTGIIVPLLSEDHNDAPQHNLRAAITAGLAHGLSKNTLIIQKINGPVPLDYRNETAEVSDEAAIREVVGRFSTEALVGLQSQQSGKEIRFTAGLRSLSLGQSAAENEFRTLSNYFFETSEFLKAQRGEVRLVAGRKGSGKTAIFFQVRDRARNDRKNLVIDLKPESHQLSLFRDELLKASGQGLFDHTIAAFWNFVLLSEIIYGFRKRYEVRAKIDDNALSIIQKIDNVMHDSDVFQSGDFTARLNKLGSNIAGEVKVIQKRGERITPERMTNIVYQVGVFKLKALVLDLARDIKEIVFLFDNIDKGWSPNEIDEFDVRLVRLLLESLDKLRHDLSASGVDFLSTVFLRNDVYELLIHNTPDRGKAGIVKIDWTDRAKLRQMIYLRLKDAAADTAAFENLWRQYFCDTVSGQQSFDFLLDHSLMRPRFLLNLIEYSVSNAINRGRDRVEAEDFRDAAETHAHYIMSDFGFEIQNVSGLPADLLYSLIGLKSTVSKEQIIDRLKSEIKLSDELSIKAFDLMLWYGILGFPTESGPRFVYNYAYDLARMQVALRANGDDGNFIINPALYVGLGV